MKKNWFENFAFCSKIIFQFFAIETSIFSKYKNYDDMMIKSEKISIKEYTGFIIQHLKPKHVITRIFHVFSHENSVKVINSLYTFFVITFCNYHYKQKVVKLIESREKFRVKTCFVRHDWIMKRVY